MIFTAHPAVLSAAFNVVMDCMPSNHVDRDPYVTTMQWSRRFLGLRLFLGLAAAGWDGYAAHVERAIDLAALLENKLVRRAWTRVNDSPMAVLCVRPPAGARDARHIAEATVASGIAWVSAVTFEGESVVRLCLTSGETQESDISRLVDILQASACP
jgi:hypothetical protein